MGKWIFFSCVPELLLQSLQKPDLVHATVMDQQEIFPCITSAALMCSKSMCFRRQAIKNSTSTAILSTAVSKAVEFGKHWSTPGEPGGQCGRFEHRGEIFCRMRCPSESTRLCLSVCTTVTKEFHCLCILILPGGRPVISCLSPFLSESLFCISLHFSFFLLSYSGLHSCAQKITMQTVCAFGQQATEKLQAL